MQILQSKQAIERPQLQLGKRELVEAEKATLANHEINFFWWPMSFGVIRNN